ncbi:Lon protease family protein [Photobacterium sp. ZSDE20]|uniref:endopeptidase La n=1 Tax=Photobacterium pectinilyticum TaxID=2906793 RepID=A0ABT1N535_9GAMM|nr:Lon protease family protein [Photobacterium sp. ZSDE20]MCQ1059850.1 Lon protease family protein [Photobacterium sp. ZSDE20]MDD1826443.1 Lon protease family protein [Photobacterium sp. ZSDE20]
MHEQNWRSMTPDYSQYQAILEQYDDLLPATTGTLQDRLSDAVRRFTAVELQPRVLRITAPDNKVYRDYVIELISQQAEAHNESPVIVAGENVTDQNLFGAVYPPIEENNISKQQVKHGLVHQANNGYLVLSVTAILANPSLWPRLKSILMNGTLEWQAASNKSLYPLPPAEQLNIKLVLIGDRYLMAELENAEPDISSGFTMYGEFEQDLIIDKDNLPLYLAYLKAIIKKAKLPELADSQALEMVLKTGARYAEDQTRVPLCPIWHQSLLCEAALESQDQKITAQHLRDSIQAREYRESYLPERAIEDIHHGQVLIDCQGEEVGQVNGLTVVEVPGHPRAYGEPARISCVVHFGDGDISDVERKAELGGNIHAKGMMIMQAFISTALDLDQPLPFSASIVFEQSYSEVDGDSASLAELCSLVSALSMQPLNQQIAVTGAVDQFGRVQAVGGINEKIEGFYQVCAFRGLTGNQGVILPKTNMTNLCLNDEILDAIKNGKFHLWSAESVDDALPLLTGQAFRSDDQDAETLLAKIAERIDIFHNGEMVKHIGLLARIRNWLVQN